MAIYYNGSHNIPCKKKVYTCQILWFCHNPTMMKNEPTRADILELILDHAANQNVTIDQEDLKGYSLEGLYNVLLDLEANI